MKLLANTSYNIVSSAGVIDVTSDKGSNNITIAGKTTHLHLLEAKQGFIFNGSLVHAGLPPNQKWCDEENTNKELQRILLQTSLDTKAAIMKETAFDRICAIHNLNKISRLHFLIFDKDSKIKHIENAVETAEDLNPETYL